MNCDIKDIRLASKGKLRIEWAAGQMPVLGLIRERFRSEKPLKGTRISCCLHVTAETANLVATLKDGGAKVSLCASNPLSTQDEVAASLVKDHGIPVFAKRGEVSSTYYRHIESTLKIEPDITMDDGADLVSTIHKKTQNPKGAGRCDRAVGGLESKIQKLPLGGTEETTTGVLRLRSLEKNKKLAYPIIAVNDARTKQFFDNRYGTGQSTIDGIVRLTNVLLSGKTFVVAGYGWCGRGIAMRARGMGANVVVTEVDPLKALEAVMDGYRVLPMEEAAKIGDIFVTSTGDVKVIGVEHLRLMKDGAIVANSGHFNVEIDITALKRLSKKVRKVREFVDEYTLTNGRRINLLAEGRLVNLVGAEGHPASVMDMSFANQALAAEFIKREANSLQNKVYEVPPEIDSKIARLKLKAMKIKIDFLSNEQKRYLSSWELGT